jgi:hypothetical protein
MRQYEVFTFNLVPTSRIENFFYFFSGARELKEPKLKFSLNTYKTFLFSGPGQGQKKIIAPGFFKIPHRI